jgi:hypothetical protein
MRPLKGTDPLNKCQSAICALEQSYLQNESYREMVEKNQFRGISGTSSPKPFLEEDLDELREHVSKFCKRQTGQITDSFFGINTEPKQKVLNQK